MMPELRAPAPANRPMQIQAENISRSFEVEGERLPVLQNVNVEAGQGEFLTILGPSGCGKSTLLNMLAGLDRPDGGRVLLDGKDVTGRVGLTGYMPQKDLLLPWRSVLDNAALPLEIAGVPRRQARERALALFPRFGLSGFERVRPSALSGGMRQRTALLRTFLTGKETLLLDEPLGALDALTRVSLQRWLLDIWEGLGKTIVLVTHDIDEALFLSDRVCVMTPRPGTIEAGFEVPIPRPRQYDSVVTSRPFAALKREMLEVLRRGDREDLL